VPDQAIALIRSRCAPNDCIYPDNVDLRDGAPPVVHPVPLEVGTTARLLDGPMADLTGICQWSDGRRVSLLMQLLGRPVKLTVAQERVETV
jgi:hypothetical protein